LTYVGWDDSEVQAAHNAPIGRGTAESARRPAKGHVLAGAAYNKPETMVVGDKFANNYSTTFPSIR
jgi:hypothetical protein